MRDVKKACVTLTRVIPCVCCCVTDVVPCQWGADRNGSRDADLV